MTTGAWVPGTSHRAVADEFEVSPKTVEGWATNASRIIRLAVAQEPEEIRARLLATLSTVTRMALGRVGVNPLTGDEYAAPDLKAAVSAVAEQAKLLGLVVQKHEVAMSEDEARKVIAEAAAWAGKT